jgi:hypothetical protein
MTKLQTSQNAPERLNRSGLNYPFGRKAMDQVLKAVDYQARTVAIDRLLREVCEQFRFDLEAISRLENEDGLIVPANSYRIRNLPKCLDAE